MSLRKEFLEHPERFVTIKEAAARVQKSEGTIRRWARLGLGSVRVGRTWWIHLRALIGTIKSGDEE
jgi:excisionase family DNA binding protein